MNNKIILALVLITIFSTIVTSASPSKDCKYSFPNGKTLDLSKIGQLKGTFANNRPVYLNFCENIPTSLCVDGDNSICSPATGMGEDVSFASKTPGATPPTTTIDPTTKAMVIHETSGKIQCFSFEPMARQLSINLQCGTPSTTFEIKDLETGCQYSTDIIIDCTFADGLSGGAIFLIVVFSALLSYFIIGALINKFWLKKDGLQIIPQANFWFSLPGLFIAGIKFVLGKLTGRGRASSANQDYAGSYGATDEENV